VRKDSLCIVRINRGAESIYQHNFSKRERDSERVRIQDEDVPAFTRLHVHDQLH